MLRHIIGVAHMAHVESDAGTPSGREALQRGSPRTMASGTAPIAAPLLAFS